MKTLNKTFNKMNTNIKNIGLGILGGIIPLSTYLYFQNPTQTPIKPILFDGKKIKVRDICRGPVI